MKVVFSDNFLKSTRALPKKIQIKLDTLICTMEINPFHPLLHSKQLTGELTGTWSFRITREWCVLFQFIDNLTVQLLRVSHRKDAYR